MLGGNTQARALGGVFQRQRDRRGAHAYRWEVGSQLIVLRPPPQQYCTFMVHIGRSLHNLESPMGRLTVFRNLEKHIVDELVQTL